MYAYAPNGIVTDLVAELPDYHPSLIAAYREVPASAPADLAVGWTFDGKKYAAPAPEPEAADAVPATVTNFQAHAALLSAGLEDKAQAAITAITDDTQRKLAQLAFDKGAFYRDSPLVAQLGKALKLKDADIDDLFRAASKIAA